MTRLAGTRDPQRPAMTASPQRARKTQERSPMGLAADPRVRLAVGAAATLITARLARQDRVGYCEAQAFQAVNGLPGSLYGPVWVIMQLGTLGAAPAAAGAALLAHDRELAGRLLTGGAGTWALSKLVKRLVRPAPASGTGQRHPHPRTRCFRARVPVRARGRGGRAGHGCLPAPQPARARRCCRRRADRRPLPHLRGRPPPAGRCRRCGTWPRHRRCRGPRPAAERPEESA